MRVNKKAMGLEWFDSLAEPGWVVYWGARNLDILEFLCEPDLYFAHFFLLA